MSQQFELDVALDSSGVQQGANQAASALGGLRNQAGLVNTALRAAVPIMAAYAGARGLGAAISAASDFERQMTELKGQVGLSTEEIKNIREETKQLAAETGQATREIAEGYKFARSAGLELAQANKLVETATKASAAGFGEQRDLVRTATTAINAWSDEVESGTEFLDEMTLAAQNMDIEVQGLSSAFRRNVNLASQLNLELDETLSGLGAVAGAAGDASRGGRLFQQVLNGLLSPTENAREHIKQVFGSIQNLRRSLEERGLIDTMVTLRKDLERTGNGLEDMFNSSRRLEGALALTADEGKRAREIMSNLDNASGNVNETFKETADSTREWNKTSQKFTNTLIEIGNDVLPLVNSLLVDVRQSINRFQDAYIGLASLAESEGTLISKALGDAGDADDFSKAITDARDFLTVGPGADSGVEFNFPRQERKKLKQQLARQVLNIEDDEVRRRFRENILPNIEAALREGASSARGVMQFLVNSELNPTSLKNIREQTEQARNEAQKQVESDPVQIPAEGPVKPPKPFNASDVSTDQLMGGRSKLNQAIAGEMDVAGVTIDTKTKTEFSEDVKELGQTTKNTFSDSLAQGFQNGFENTDDLIDDFENQMIRALSQSTAEGLTQQLLTGMQGLNTAGGGGSQGGWVSTGLNWLGGFFDTPGVQEVGSQGGAASFAPGDKFVAAKSEQGLRNQVGTGESGGQNVSIQQENNFPVMSEEKIDRRIRKAAPQIADRAADQVFKAMQGGGPQGQTARQA